jgi:RNA polymerase sigma-70 factor (ECF subfamily)
MTAPIDAQLVGRAAKRDPVATEHLFARIRPGVLRYCRARLGAVTGGYITAEDVTQDVCLALIKALPNYRDQSRPFSAFVYAIAARKVADVYRASGRSGSIPVGDLTDEPDRRAGPEALAVAGDAARRLSGVLGGLLHRLPPEQREIIVLRVAVRLTADEVGRMLGMTPVAVRVAQHRAMAKLRTLAAGHFDEGSLP